MVNNKTISKEINQLRPHSAGVIINQDLDQEVIKEDNQAEKDLYNLKDMIIEDKIITGTEKVITQKLQKEVVVVIEEEEEVGCKKEAILNQVVDQNQILGKNRIIEDKITLTKKEISLKMIIKITREITGVVISNGAEIVGKIQDKIQEVIVNQVHGTKKEIIKLLYKKSATNIGHLMTTFKRTRKVIQLFQRKTIFSGLMSLTKAKINLLIKEKKLKQ